MKVKNYRILLTIWIGLILFFLGQFLYGCLFQTIYPTLMDMLYAITSFLWKYFLSILAMSLFVLIQPLEINQINIVPTTEEVIEADEKERDKAETQETIVGIPISNRAKAIIVSIMVILAFFLVRHIILVNVCSNYYLIVWNFIYFHIFVSVVSLLYLILVLQICFKKGSISKETDEI